MAFIERATFGCAFFVLLRESHLGYHDQQARRLPAIQHDQVRPAFSPDALMWHLARKHQSCAATRKTNLHYPARFPQSKRFEGYITPSTVPSGFTSFTGLTTGPHGRCRTPLNLDTLNTLEPLGMAVQTRWAIALLPTNDGAASCRTSRWIKDIRSRVTARRIDATSDTFTFEQLEKALRTALSWQLPRRLMLLTRLWSAGRPAIRGL